MWIETPQCGQVTVLCSVTPHTGVWIETRKPSGKAFYILSRPTRACGLKRHLHKGQRNPMQSRPTRACGLKQSEVKVKSKLMAVTPHTGVWIETRTRRARCHRYTSRPTRACGLKLRTVCRYRSRVRSRPTRACGLKQLRNTPMQHLTTVTPHTGVWIETPTLLPLSFIAWSRPTRACGLKLQIMRAINFIPRHAPHGRVD